MEELGEQEDAEAGERGRQAEGGPQKENRRPGRTRRRFVRGMSGGPKLLLQTPTRIPGKNGRNLGAKDPLATTAESEEEQLGVQGGRKCGKVKLLKERTLVSRRREMGNGSVQESSFR